MSTNNKGKQALTVLLLVLVLVILSWPLALFIASWYVWIMPFEGVFLVLFKTDIIYTVTDFLERLLVWPRALGRAIFVECGSGATFPLPPTQGFSNKERISEGRFDWKKIHFTILWLVLLIFISLPLAIFVMWFWIIAMPFESVLNKMTQIDGKELGEWLSDFLFIFVNWPRSLTKAMFEQSEEFPNPFSTEEASTNQYEAAA